MAAHSKHHYRRRAVLIFIAIVTLATPLVTLISFEAAYRGRVYPGVILGDLLPSSREKIVTLVWQPEDKPERQWQIKLADLDLAIDSGGTQARLMRVGRSGNFIADIKDKIIAYRHGIAVDPMLSYDRNLLSETINNIAGEIDRPVSDPKFRLSANRVTEFKPGTLGLVVDRQLLEDRFVVGAFSGPMAENSGSIIEIPVASIQPKRPAGDMTAESMGIKELLGRGQSTYQGSIAGRKHNIALTASRIDGILIAPGETFSFNHAVGEINRATGYQSAYIISNGRTVLGDGGGVCQVSTTLFRAALAAGLPIAERRAHSYRVSYYEQNSPPGFDATVYAPSPDFKFTNDTPAYILIQARADSDNTSLVIDLWGTSDSRVATTTKPVVTKQIAPPPDLYQDDPSLPAGVVKQVDWKAAGATVVFKYTVTRGGEKIYDKTFLSVYRPWQAVFLRGTGGG